MKIAITGHDGFIGKHLVNGLIYNSRFNSLDISLIDQEDFLDQFF